ncbi:hypothetical protein HNP24_004269 [Chryseobacterium sediminis]|uniref:Uncharacterized protein n=1 Tax=Chryseobacterium sediminis TaxID=1679494 RepID=A0ABR6Q5I9_9FLAO|nr:hypothetical protein [Chryseobacterium sediminis]MBB6333245.1 hypothetical protein [Chryseobacterium sediminis]
MAGHIHGDEKEKIFHLSKAGNMLPAQCLQQRLQKTYWTYKSNCYLKQKQWEI